MRALLAAMAVIVGLTMTGCGVQTEQEIKDMGNKAQVCKDSGGRPYMSGLLYQDIACNFTERF